MDEAKRNPVIAALGNIDGLDVEAALAGIGGMCDVYEQSVKLTARLMRGLLERMDKCIAAGDLEGFSVEAHGLKGALRNIGAGTCGNTAARLERAAAAGDADYCGQHYPAFKEQLLSLAERLNKALGAGAVHAKEKGDTAVLLEAFRRAKTAALSYDAIQAHDILKPLERYSFNGKADEALGKLIDALEEFNFESVFINIKKLEEVLL